jgi:hypothetical protein
MTRPFEFADATNAEHALETLHAMRGHLESARHLGELAASMSDACADAASGLEDRVAELDALIADLDEAAGRFWNPGDNRPGTARLTYASAAE